MSKDPVIRRSAVRGARIVTPSALDNPHVPSPGNRSKHMLLHGHKAEGISAEREQQEEHDDSDRLHDDV